MVVQYKRMVAEMQMVVAAGGQSFYLTAQNPNLPRSIVSLRDLQVTPQPRSILLKEMQEMNH